MKPKELKSAFFNEVIKADRKIELDHEYATSDASDDADRVRMLTANYLEGYASFNKISPEAAIASYSAVVRRYVNDIRAFVATGKYPLELNENQGPLSRLDYDLFLIITILATKHRCAIMEELSKFKATKRALVIGVGSGVELAFVGTHSTGEAYDLYINPFARSAFPGWQFLEELYHPVGRQYDAIYAIELLEHLHDPYALLEDCRKSLSPKGRLLVTTATNVPQFDHRFNFTSDQDFERRATALGLTIEHKRVIPHAYPRTEIGARNVFYALAVAG